MVHRFADYTLDEQARELRFQGREVVLQPRVFDLLVYLVRHRERVVAKEELLDTLWPGVVVTEGSMQRAVSLARSALRPGGLAQAIRTYARQGYRFCAEVAAEAAAPGATAPELERARRAHEQGQWEEAIEQYVRSDREQGGLEAADLERWAYAVQCTGRIAEAVAPLERAVAAQAAAGDRRGAARAALQLVHVLFEEGKFAVAKGWHRRAARFLAGAGECAETGMLEVQASRLAFADGDMEQVVARTEAACDLGRRLDDADVEALGLVYQAHALLALGQARRALALLDEAAAAVFSGQVNPLAGGAVYCGVIWGCRNHGDWQRASDWNEQFTRWCAGSGLFTYSGSCHMHRAEVLGIHGELDAAEREIDEACRLLPVTSARMEGEAHRILGDLRLARGDLAGAEAAFQRAHACGFDPQPGYALLQQALGHDDAARRSLERSLGGRNWANRQRRGLLLAHLAILAATGGRLEKARDALEQLDGEDGIEATPALAALRARAWAELAFAEGHVPESIAALRRAVALWQQAGSPLNVASQRLRLAELLLADGDPQASALELAAAEPVFARLDARLLLERCRALCAQA